jgi:hypothetical protein
MWKTVGLKTAGYLVSIVSVALLGVASWPGASKHPVTLAALFLGMAISIIGMGLRWWSFLRDHRDALAGRKPSPTELP